MNRGALAWVVAVGVLLVVLLAGAGAQAYDVVFAPDTGLLASSDSDTSQPAPPPGYIRVEDDSGRLSVEVPSDWDDLNTGGVSAEGEKGRNWSSFAGEMIGSSISAINDREAWSSGTRGHRGTYIVASKGLARMYTDDELVNLGPNAYSTCEAGTPQDFYRPPSSIDQPSYSGRRLDWSNCGGFSDHTAITLAAAPEGRECVVVLQIGEFGEPNEEARQRILDTFEADCEGIP